MASDDIGEHMRVRVRHGQGKLGGKVSIHLFHEVREPKRESEKKSLSFHLYSTANTDLGRRTRRLPRGWHLHHLQPKKKPKFFSRILGQGGAISDDRVRKKKRNFLGEVPARGAILQIDPGRHLAYLSRCLPWRSDQYNQYS